MLSFNIFNIPVRVQPMFWLFSGLFGYIIMGGSSNNTEVLFISIALSLIILESMGGRALFSSSNFTRTQHVITIAAGPLMNFILAGIFFLLYKFGTEPLNIPKESLLHRGIEITWIINTLLLTRQASSLLWSLQF